MRNLLEDWLCKLLFVFFSFFGIITATSANTDTWDSYRFRNMLPQELDISCGAASLATLARFYGKADVNEKDILDRLSSNVPAEDQSDVLEKGFSLLHLKKVIAEYGLDLKAAKTHNAQLVQFSSPAILQLKTKIGYHFVVWHGMHEGLHWLGDPSRGDLWLTDAALSQEWTGIAAWLYRDGVPLQTPTNEQLRRAYHNR